MFHYTLWVEKTTHTPRVHLVIKAIQFLIINLFMITIDISMLFIVYVLYYVNKHQEKNIS